MLGLKLIPVFKTGGGGGGGGGAWCQAYTKHTVGKNITMTS